MGVEVIDSQKIPGRVVPVLLKARPILINLILSLAPIFVALILFDYFCPIMRLECKVPL